MWKGESVGSKISYCSSLDLWLYTVKAFIGKFTFDMSAWKCVCSSIKKVRETEREEERRKGGRGGGWGGGGGGGRG